MEEVMLQTQWGWQIALYLFLGGLGAGTLLVAGIVNIKRGEAMKKPVRFGAWAGTLCLIVGVLLLVTEVSMPLRALLLWQSFSHLGSWMAIGAWLLVVGIAGAGIWALTLSIKAFAKAARPLSFVAIVLGVCIAAYTGILLCVLEAHPLWNTLLLPLLFTVSAIDTGVALLVLFAGVRMKGVEEAKPVLAVLERSTLVLVAAEAVVLVAMLVLVGTGSDVGALSVGLLVSGQLAPWFWVAFVLLGLVVPLVITLAVPRMADGKGAGLTLPGAVCVLVGGCALRFLILLAGLPVWA